MKKLFIISENTDKSTNEVIEWLFKFNIDFTRLNVDTTTSLTIDLTNKKYNISIDNYRSQDFFIWLRRGKLQLLSSNLRNTFLNKYLNDEMLPALEFLEHELSMDNKITGTYVKEKLNNKIESLKIAKHVGLKIPSTIISNNKDDLLRFQKKYKRIISKSFVKEPIANEYYFETKGTYLVSFGEINSMSDIITPSLVQEYVDKKFEVRTFVIDKIFFSMAIFSQSNNKTKIDFRNYDNDNPNRLVPFSLPDEIKLKVLNLLEIKGVTTGSIDFIVTNKNEFYFLEINLQGQFDWLSKSCNYYIERKIAIVLSNKVKHNEN